MNEQQIDHLLRLIALHTVLWRDPDGHYRKLTGTVVEHDKEMKATIGTNKHIDLRNVDIDDLMIVNVVNPSWAIQ